MLTVEENESLHVQVARLRRENAALKDALDISMNVNARDPEHTYRQLVESEARYRALFENINSGFVLFEAILGPNGEPEDLRILSANEKFARTTGLNNQEAAGRRLTELLPGIEHDQADWIGVYCRVATTGVPVRIDDGSELLGRYYSVQAYQPEPGLCAVSFLDVTEQKIAERLLKSSEERFSRAFHVSPISLTITNASTGEFVEVNQTFVDLFGFEEEELLGKRATELGLLTPKERTRAVTTHRIMGGVRHFDLWGQTKSGERIDLIAYSSDIEFDGEAHHITHLVDVTERNQEKAALRASESRYQALFDQAPDAIIIADIDQRIRGANAMACRLFGHSPEKFASELTARELITSSQANLQKEAFRRVFAGERVVTERQFVRQDGSEFVGELIASKIDEDQILAIVRDLTQTKEVERQRRQLEDKLQASQRLEAIGILAGGVAHDFNNLLSVILSYSELAMNALVEIAPNNLALDDLGQVIEAGERAAALTRQLLAFSRKQILQPKALDLNTVARELEKMLRRLIGEDIEYVHTLSATPATVLADPGQMEQVVMNLVLNARDAMPSGGRLEIETANVILDASHPVVTGGLPPGPYARLTVSDTGTGMPPETVRHIFEPFFTTKGKSKGTGLGLSMVHGIVKQSGGDIFVDSEQGQGTQFRIYLTTHTATLAEPSTATRSKRPVAGTETVLVVEDEGPLRKVAVRCLEREGYRVLDASGGLEAVEIASSFPERIDLLLSDVVMPEIGGPAVADKVRELRPGLKVLYMSGYPDDIVANHGILDVHAHFLEKPFTGQTLSQKVREVLDES